MKPKHMKLKHIIAGGVASALLGAAAFAQQSPSGVQAPTKSDAMQRVNGAMQSDQSMKTGSSMNENKIAAPQRSRMNVNVSSAVIRQAQEKLSAQGYIAGSADGVWGPKTRAALEKFQKTKDITPTGVLDPQTLAALGINGQQTAAANTGGTPQSGGAAAAMMKRKQQG